MTSNYSLDDRVKLYNVDLTNAEFVKILSLFTSGIEAKGKKVSINQNLLMQRPKI